MRRSLLGLLTVVAVAGLLLVAGCERSSVLRVVQINGGHTVESDIADFAIWVDPTVPDSEQEKELVYAFAPDTAEVELQYVEIGAGLPVWTPFEAIINKAVFTYKSEDPTVTYDPVTIPLTQAVMADQAGKKTKKWTMVVVPAWWKGNTFGDEVQEPPEYNMVDIVEATVKFSGWDSVSLRTVEATGKFQIEFGNFPDNQEAFGK
jgi:hypothetical protein